MAEAFEELAIVALDAHGEGVAANGAIVPGALPGERALRPGSPASGPSSSRSLSAAPERAQPICPWFGRCGGCAAQHMSDGLYRQWKRGLVVEALEARRRRGRGRRAGRRAWRGPPPRDLSRPLSPWPADEVGFMRVRSHDIVAIDDCPLFAPAWRARSPRRGRSRAISGDSMKPLDIGVTATLDGLDVDLRGSGAARPRGSAEARADGGRARSRAGLQSRRDRDRAPAAARRLRRGAGHASARRLPAGDGSRRNAARGIRRAGARRLRRGSRTSSAAPAPLRCGSRAGARSSPSIPTLPRSRRSSARPRRRRACASSPPRRAISSAGRCAPTISPHSTRRSSIRHAPGRSSRRARSPHPRCRSSCRSPATRRPSPATRAFSSTAAFGSRR